MNWLKKLFTRKRALNSERLSVKMFCEPPMDFPPENFISTGLPKDFIQTADTELGLNGDLVEFVNVQPPSVENMKRLEDRKRNEFFANLSAHGAWKVYFGTGASGARYTVFVDFLGNDKQSAEPKSDSLPKEARKKIYKDFNTAFMKWIVRGMVHFPNMSDDEKTATATNTAMDEVMKEHGISKSEMIQIVNEGAEKWGHLRE